MIGYQTDRFPAFFTTDSGLPAPLRLDCAASVAAWLRAQRSMGLESGAVVAVPNPEPAPQALIDGAIAQALQELEQRTIGGKEATPFLLQRCVA
eukprot:SAG11_NODE_8273_length_1036_cov_2.138741_1_plen_94_part_00